MPLFKFSNVINTLLLSIWVSIFCSFPKTSIKEIELNELIPYITSLLFELSIGLG